MVNEEDSGFFLYEDKESAIKLQESHQYYYQVQMQMKFCNSEYCDFVVWNKNHGSVKEYMQTVILSIMPLLKQLILLIRNSSWACWQMVHKTILAEWSTISCPVIIHPVIICPVIIHPVISHPVIIHSVIIHPVIFHSAIIHSVIIHPVIIHPVVIVIILSARILSATMWQTDVEWIKWAIHVYSWLHRWSY